MSKMRSDRRPPLAAARSPLSLRPPRRVVHSSAPSLQTPPGSLTKSGKPIRRLDGEESDLRPEYRSISCELRALAKMVQSEIGKMKSEKIDNVSGSMFERGRLYDEYSARRNERLKRKIGGESGESSPKTVYGLGVKVESGKRRETKKRESLRKSVATVYSVEATTPRYMLRSMSKDKENKKPPLPLNVNSERRIGTRRGKI